MNFKEIEGFENYLIYEDGRVFNKKFNRFLNPQVRKRKDRPIDKCYYNVRLSKNGKKYSKLIHRLLAIAFIPNPNNLEMIDHIDRNTQNNNITNLRWCNNSTNMLNTGVPKSNKLGIKYIRKTTKIENNNTYEYYRFYVKSTFNKQFKTLEEAVEFRNEWIKENPKFNIN